MTKQFIIALLLLPALWAGCKKAQLMTYEASDNVYFYYAKSANGVSLPVYYDTAQINFGRRLTATKDSVVFTVNLMGRSADSDRPFVMKVDADSTTGVAGVHYELPPADSLFMPAMAVKKTVTIRIMRPAVLRDTVAVVYLRLAANDYFGINRPVYTYTSTAIRSGITLKLILDDRLLQPSVWEASANSLGRYTREKLELMVTQQKLDVNKFYAATFYTASQLTSFSRTMQTYLNTQKSQGKTVYEKDGTEMKMGPGVQ